MKNFKTINITLSVTVFLIFMTIVMSGCKKELGVFLLNEMKNENPYNGYETLIYLSSNGDTIVFIGNGRHRVEFHSDHNYGNQGKYYVNELDRCLFIDVTGNFELFIQLASRTGKAPQGSQSDIRTSYLLDITFSHNCNSVISNRRLPISDYQNSSNYLDCVLINGKYYLDALILETDYNNLCDTDPSPEDMNSDSIYYSTSHGILKIIFEDNEVWELESIN